MWEGAEFQRGTQRHQPLSEEENQKNARYQFLLAARDTEEFLSQLEKEERVCREQVDHLCALYRERAEGNKRLMSENKILLARVDETMKQNMADICTSKENIAALRKDIDSQWESLILGQLAENFKDKLFRSVYHPFVPTFLPCWEEFVQELEHDSELQKRYDDLKGQLGGLPNRLGGVLEALLSSRVSVVHPANHHERGRRPVLKEDILRAIANGPEKQRGDLERLCNALEKLATNLNEPLFCDLSQ
ncbi:hypothetical protein QOT17_011598 [Balamuthia mandrillaris]